METTTEAASADDVERIRERVRKLAATGDLGAYGFLPSTEELARSFSTDVETVRQALEALETEGVVWRDAVDRAGHEGRRALHPTFDPMHIIEARLCIEPALAALCAQRATSSEVEDLMHLLERAEEDPENDTWDASLHGTIASLARSGALHAAFDVIEEARASPSWQVALGRARTPEHRAIYRSQHMSIVDAICHRDPSAAHEAMTKHIEQLKRHMAVALGPR